MQYETLYAEMVGAAERAVAAIEQGTTDRRSRS